MIQPVASQQSPLKSGAVTQAQPRPKPRRSGTTESSRDVRTPDVDVLSGRPGINPKFRPSKASERRLRLIGGGGNPAQKVWRLEMETTDIAFKIPGLSGALRLFSAARAVLALVGLAVAAVESRYNPVAESNMGAKGLMQVIPKFHAEKLVEHGGEGALLDPQINIQVGAQILREYLRRYGETETALQMYAGAFDEPGSSYAFKVLAERSRLEQMVRQLRRGASA